MPRRGGDNPVIDANRLRNMVDTTLIVVLASLVPVVIDRFGATPAWTWRISALIFLTLLSMFLVVAGRRERRIR